MKRFTYLALFSLLISSLAFGATEIRKLGGPGALNNGDIYFGTAYWDSPSGRRVYFVNASMLPFGTDNTKAVELLYPLAAGTAWRLFYTNGSGVQTPLAFDNVDLCLKSGGASAAPTWGECGTGAANIEDEAFGSAWNGDTTNGASKNSIYDWAHLFDTDDDGKVNVLDMGAGIVKTNSSGAVSIASSGTDYVAPGGNVATATALAADPTDCTGGQFATGIAASGNLTCTTPSGSGDMLKYYYDNNVNNVVDSAEALSAQYIDWNQTTGPTSIANRPTLGTAALQNVGTLTNTYLGTYVTGTGFVFNTNPASFQSADADLTTLSSPGNDKIFYSNGSGVISTVTLGTTGTYLKSNGTGSAPTWSTSSATPGGSDTQVQFNDGSSFGGDAGMVYDKTLNTLTVDNTIISAKYSTSSSEHFINVADTEPPAAPADGDCYYDTDTNDWRCYNGSAWTEVFTSGAAHTLNFATTGTITGGIMILSDVASPTAAQCYGSWNETSGAGTHTLPAVAAGMSICHGTSAAAEITLELDGSDHFVLNGVTMSDGEAIINTTGEAAGDYICVIGIDASTWKVVGKQGTWTQATP
jgi:hypothetical protein